MKTGYNRLEKNPTFKEFYSEYLHKYEIENDKFLQICVADNWHKTDANKIKNNIVEIIKIEKLLEKNHESSVSALKEKYDNYSVNGAFAEEDDSKVWVLLTELDPGNTRKMGPLEAKLWSELELSKLK